MRNVWTMGLVLAWSLALAGSAHAGVNWAIGVRLGFPVGYPCYGPPYGYYYRPYPVYVAGPPAVLVPAPAPVVVASSPAVAVPTAVPAEGGYNPPPPPPPAPGYGATTAVSATANPAGQTIARAARPEEAVNLNDLRNPDERVRARVAVEAGRRKDGRALAALIRALREDPSPVVREAAARGLGLIGERAALAALQNAAQADDDRDVRHSAAFAADVIRANLPRW
jgi:hypothetical protein